MTARAGDRFWGGVRRAPGRSLDTATAQDFGVRVFTGIRCAACGAGLHDAEGNPRWDIFGQMRFVCAGGCRPRSRNAELS